LHCFSSPAKPDGSGQYMKTASPNETATIWRPLKLNNIELLRARFKSHTFSRHFHTGYAVGVIESGALGFNYLGKKMVAEPGNINLAIPGETHNGFAACEQGWQYRMFYLDADIMTRAAADLTDRSAEAPIFNTGVINDPWLASQIRDLHIALERSNASRLEQESRLLWILSKLIERHADPLPKVPVNQDAPRTVARAREYIETHYQDSISLQTLSRVTGLSRFHLLRLFHREVGLPPHAYLQQIRLSRAKDLLAHGNPITKTALDAGFSDQSHLNRLFKRMYGVTPGVYSNSVQDA
jgi:AraC-like DNA-binding protein